MMHDWSWKSFEHLTKGQSFRPNRQFRERCRATIVRGMLSRRSQIAIVDDDPGMGRAIGRLCGALALPSRCFASAEEFLASGALDETSLLILDVQLPGLTGFELNEQLVSRGIRLPVVFITGQDQALSRARALTAGAAGYLPKPFQANELITVVRKHLPTPEQPTY